MVSPKNTTEYTLVCAGAGGSTTGKVVVRVLPALAARQIFDEDRRPDPEREADPEQTIAVGKARRLCVAKLSATKTLRLRPIGVVRASLLPGAPKPRQRRRFEPDPGEEPGRDVPGVGRGRSRALAADELSIGRQECDSKTRTQSSKPELLVPASGLNRRDPVASNGAPLNAENRPSAGSYHRAATCGPAS
jgi:hypothetical protein